MDSSINYLALGDSITFGKGAPPRQGFAFLIADKLREIYRDVDFINISRKGLTSRGLVSLVHDPRLQPYLRRSQLITLLIGGNDLSYAYMRYVITGNRSEIDQALYIYSRQFNHLLQWLRTNTSAKVYSFTLYNPFPNEPLSNQVIPALNQFTIKHSKEWKVSIVDLYKPFTHKQTKYIEGYRTGHFNDFIPFLQANPIHPNLHGHKKIAQLFWNRF